MKRSVIQQIADLDTVQRDMFPQINVEPEIHIKPVIEVVTPAADMKPIAAAIRSIKQNIEVTTTDRQPSSIKLHFERDRRGFIQSPITIEREYDS